MIKAILFDLGGVLVRLRAEEHARTLFGPHTSLPEFWRTWLYSPAVRAHETGKIDATTFASQVVAEMKLPVTADDFLAGFATWINGTFDETHVLMQACHARYTTALLTNVSAFHWPIVESLNILPYAHHVHASFQVGLIKPDHDYFEVALTRVGVRADEAIFFDDSHINIAAARAVGIEAHEVKGASAVLQVLRERALLP
jgi:putative hydrolase of the HAD superfamily